MRAWIVVGTVAALLAMTLPDAVAAGTVPQPLDVRSASLTQDGLQLIWRVRLVSPFSPKAMKRDGRTLCLVIERARNGSVSGVLCVAPPGKHGHPILVYQPVTARGRGHGQAITATVARPSDAELSASFLPASVGVSYTPIKWQVLSTLAAQTTWFPRRPVLARLHTPMPVGCAPSGPPFVLNGPANRRVVALTFDDGPWGTPPATAFLDVLEREHAVATFFEIGDQISQYDPTGAIERRMLADGDMIGDHTWNHANVAGAGPFAASEIAQGADAIRQKTGFQPCLFRAPYGAVSSPLTSLARSMGYTTIQWDIDPRDWSLPGTDAIYNNVVANAHNGAIVIEHFGGGPRYETLAALPREIETLRSEGYGFVTVTDLLGQTVTYK